MEPEVNEEIAPEETPKAPPAPPPIAPDIVQEALDTGWLPEDQFKGDKTKWRPADQWVERGRTLIPIIKKQTERDRQEIAQLKSVLESQKKVTERLLKMSERSQEIAYEKAKRELTAKQMDAVTAGDAETWARLKEEEDKLEKPEKIQVEQPQSQNSPDFDVWYPNNKWYRAVGTTDGDLDLTIYADGYAATLQKNDPSLTHAQILSATERKVKEVFPHKFENPNRNLPPTVDGGSISQAPASDGKKTYADLSSAEKQVCDRNVQDGLYKSKEDWVKAYFEEE